MALKPLANEEVELWVGAQILGSSPRSISIRCKLTVSSFLTAVGREFAERDNLVIFSIRNDSRSSSRLVTQYSTGKINLNPMDDNAIQYVLGSYWKVQ